MVPSRWKKPPRARSDNQLATHVRQLKDVNVSIHEELVTSADRSHRWTIVMAAIGILTLIATLAGIGVALRIQSGVDDIADLGAQETVDMLRLGITQDELATLIGSPPIADEVLTHRSEIAGETVRRVVFSAPNKGIAVMALVDAFHAAQLVDECLDGYSGFGGGASWGYLAIGCEAYG